MTQFPIRSQQLVDLADERIIILDGAFGTMLQSLNLTEDDFRGSRFKSHGTNLRGCNDVLCLTCPQAVAGIHRQYLEAGADIIETNSFNANAISLADYALSEYAAEINLAAAEIARAEADEHFKATGRRAYVAGSVGPTNKSLTMAVTLDDDIDWDTMVAAYTTQMTALIKGGADLLIIETIFDTLNAKAAIYAAETTFERTGTTLPLILSVTLTESGRTLSGQSLEAFAATVAHANPFAVGLNCGFGIEGMAAHIATLQPLVPRVSVYANAGLPDKLGRYNETPQMMADALRPILESGQLNIVGGCCGTTPNHIRAIAREAAAYSPRPYRKPDDTLILAGLDRLAISPETNFVNVGERCNVAGSRKFLRLIKENNYDEALEIARTQVEKGAQIVDVNMDDALLDASQCISRFIRLAQVDPDIAAVPVMVDSSDWNVILAGLKTIQGKPVVNSISLKVGEEAFIEHARTIRRFGAAMVVMAFDEEGQATSFERKTEICARSYRLLTTRAGVPPQDIIFDPNILSIATGIPEHNRYAVDFIEATRWIKKNLPGAKISGGLSNLSFSFRGNNQVREAMHAIFLSHAIPAGMDMAIVNAASLPSPDEIPPRLAQLVEDVILDKDDDAADRLVEEAQLLLQQKEGVSAETHRQAAEPASLAPDEALTTAVARGLTANLDALVGAALQQAGSAVEVINGPLMAAMNLVGQRFGEGKIFLPQVVKSASAMKAAVDILTPVIEAEKAMGKSDAAISRPKMVIATVKGDVHDIGKNIVSVIMRCNGYDVIDLGVMVPAETIVERARSENADIVGLSGLITPSLEEMCNVARLMERTGLTMPLFIGGATTSDLHTAIKIAPLYSSSVVHTRDAAQMPGRVKEFIDPATADEAGRLLLDEQERLRNASDAPVRLLSLAEARALRPHAAPGHTVTERITPKPLSYEWDIDTLRPLINWRAFLAAWKLDASLASLAPDARNAGPGHNISKAPSSQKQAKAIEARRLLKDADDVLASLAAKGLGVKAIVDCRPACSTHDDEILISAESGRFAIPTLRQQLDDNGLPRVALSDFINPAAPDGSPDDFTGIFAVSTGAKIQQLIDDVAATDEYMGLVYRTVADRLAEAATEATHRQALHDWGYTDGDVNLSDLEIEMQSIRPAVGYPSLPDQSLVFIIDRILDLKRIELVPTESGALNPPASTAGLIILNPKSRYFILGKIGDDQRNDYLSRHPLGRPDQARFLPQ